MKLNSRVLNLTGAVADAGVMDSHSDRLRAIIATQTEIAASDLDLLAAMGLIAERSQELTRASGAVIEIIDGEEMVYEVTTGDATPYLGMRLALADSLSGLCVQEERLLRSDDTSDDPRVDGEACQRVGAASMICVPLSHRREPVGVLKVYSNLVSNFTDDDVETLELLTDLVAAHISHATRFEVEAYENRHDSLTGLYNRRAYEERLAVETSRATRYEQPLSICLFDLDGFKELNDRHGHAAGDEVLCDVARLIDDSRVADDAFRIGGDEFALLMPQTAPPDARIAAERLARRIVDAKLGAGSIGVSFGIAAGTSDPELSHLAADTALLRAKDRLYGQSDN